MSLDLSNPKKIHFIGIGGIAMSAVACLAARAGHFVTGSDSKDIYDPSKAVLEENFIEYYKGYNSEKLATIAPEIFVATSAEDESNPEIAFALQNGTLNSLSQLAAALADDKVRIVVAGTHGKSTTSSLLGEVLSNISGSGYMVGAVLTDTGRNWQFGDGPYFVFEGDEYKSLFDDPTPKFIQYKADALLLTNLEFDHPDIYSSETEIEAEFEELIERLPDDGIVVYNKDSAGLEKVVYRTPKRAFSYSLTSEATFRLTSVEYHTSHTTLTLLNSSDPENPKQERYLTKLAGEMNVANVLAVISFLRVLGFQEEKIAPYILDFNGIKRRFEEVYQSDSLTIIDDYAHHPTAVTETIKAARQRFPDRNVIAVFEPHTYTRTAWAKDELVTALSSADLAVIPPIYKARETENPSGISSEQLVDEINKTQGKAVYVEDLTGAKKAVQESIQQNKSSVVLIMAVGSFNKLAAILGT